jgi:tRNA 2-thiouridine synthesizing protein A
MLLDARNLRCPMPLLKLKQTLHGLPPGADVTVLTTDPGSLRDFEAFLRQAGHELREVAQGEDGFRFEIRKKA